MRWSQAFIPTLKETPAEAEIVSHKLLLRAGLDPQAHGRALHVPAAGLARAAQGGTNRARRDGPRGRAGSAHARACNRRKSGSKAAATKRAQGVLFKARDRAKKEWILGPTHEEVITTLVAGELSSYRQLPKNFYQIQTKFRDEIRPRFGLMRAKEFVMKDAYSFDATDEAAQASYKKMYDAYARIFQRCGLKAMAVEADTGVMGGKFSHEFMVPAETGENEVVYCEGCHYAANVEKAQPAAPAGPIPPKRARHGGEIPHAGRRDHRGFDPPALSRPGRAADQDAGLYGREQAGADFAARRPSTERGETDRRAWHGERFARPKRRRFSRR